MSRISLDLNEREFKLLLKALTDREERLMEAAHENEEEPEDGLEEDETQEDEDHHEELALYASDLTELQQVKESLEKAGVETFGENCLDIDEDFV